MNEFTLDNILLVLLVYGTLLKLLAGLVVLVIDDKHQFFDYKWKFLVFILPFSLLTLLIFRATISFMELR